MNQNNRMIPAVVVLTIAFSACVSLAASPAGELPMLVVTEEYYAANPLSNYLPEIIQSEGLVEFEQVKRSSFSSLSPTLLQSYETIYLAEMDLSAADEQLLRGYVAGGGNLIAMRPDADLSDVFGVTVQGNRTEQLLQYYGAADDLSGVHGLPQGMGVVNSSLQYHGAAANYALNGAKTIASLYDDADTPSANPAVTLNRYGQGHAVAYAFDLAKSIALQRQGNPAWQNTEGDSKNGYRPLDTFMRTDGSMYFDTERIAIPQADESQRMLANITMNLADSPLPRMWYLPGMHKSVMINTGDAEDLGGTQLDPAFDDCASYGGHYTAYLRNINRGIENTTVAQEAAWRAAGHEVGVHVYAGGAEGAGAETALNEAYATIVGQLESKFGHGSRTARNHTIDWTGWVFMAAIEAAHGTEMDMNYYHYINTVDPLTCNGYFTGSGLPQRMIDIPGTILPIYQAATQWPDEWFEDKEMTVEQTVGIITGMFEAAEQQGFYSSFVNNIHQIRYNGMPGVDELTALWPSIVWQYCVDHDIPSWSAEMLLDFVDARNASQFENINWSINDSTDVGVLHFDFSTPDGGQDLTVMLPVQSENRTLARLFAGGFEVEPAIETIKGIEYAMFTTSKTLLHFVALYNPSHEGDANGDGRVDADDAAMLAANWLCDDATWLMGDFTGDGFIDDADAAILAANWGFAASSVPEPGIAALLLGLLFNYPSGFAQLVFCIPPAFRRIRPETPCTDIAGA